MLEFQFLILELYPVLSPFLWSLQTKHYQIFLWMAHHLAQNTSAFCLTQISYYFIYHLIISLREQYFHVDAETLPLWIKLKHVRTLLRIFFFRGDIIQDAIECVIGAIRLFPNSPFYVFYGRSYSQVSGNELKSTWRWVKVLSRSFILISLLT